MKPKPADTLRREMIRALGAEIRRLRSAQQLLSKAERDILAQTEATFEDRHAAACWLAQKQHALGGNIPLVVASTRKGTAQVRRVLWGIEHGVYL